MRWDVRRLHIGCSAVPAIESKARLTGQRHVYTSPTGRQKPTLRVEPLHRPFEGDLGASGVIRVGAFDQLDGDVRMYGSQLLERLGQSLEPDRLPGRTGAKDHERGTATMGQVFHQVIAVFGTI